MVFFQIASVLRVRRSHELALNRYLIRTVYPDVMEVVL